MEPYKEYLLYIYALLSVFALGYVVIKIIEIHKEATKEFSKHMEDWYNKTLDE